MGLPLKAFQIILLQLNVYTYDVSFNYSIETNIDVLVINYPKEMNEVNKFKLTK